MSCESIRPLLMESVYEEIDPDGRRLLEEHLDGCETCRRELDELRDASSVLRAYEPERPAAPRLVVVAPGRRRLGFLPSFAGGFAAAAALLLLGFAVGAIWSSRSSGDTAAPPEPVAVERADRDAVSREELDAVLAAFEDRIRQEGSQDRAELREELTAAARENAITPGDLEARFAKYDNEVNERRRRDLKYVLNEIAASELRSGAALGETQQAVRYLAAARRPEASEW